MNRIKIYGERNSGTNYLSKLISINLDTTQIRGTVPNSRFWKKSEFTKNLYFKLTQKSNLGWKHALVKTDDLKSIVHIQNVKFVTLTKNPYSFLLSLFKRPYHYKGKKPETFNAFLQSEWGLQKRDNIKGAYCATPIELWNLKNASYIRLKHDFNSQTINLKYEDLLLDPEGTFSYMSNSLGIDNLLNFKNHTESTKENQKSFAFYEKYYLQQEWIKELNEKDLKIINTHLDAEVMQHFGYKFI